MSKIILALSIILLTVFAHTANATITGFQFTGHWTSVDTALDSWFTTNNSFQAVVRYDTDQSASYSGSGGGGFMSRYNNNYFTISSGAWGETSSNTIIRVYDNVNHKDQFSTQFFSTAIPPFTYAIMGLKTTNEDLFTDTTLPANIDDIIAAPFNCTLSFYHLNNNTTTCAQAFGSIDTISPLPVPEPGTCLLLGSGLLAITSIYRRRKKSAQNFQRLF